MAIRFCPACGEADNPRGLSRSSQPIGSPRATFHHGPEPLRSPTRPEIRLQSEPQLPHSVARLGQQGAFIRARASPQLASTTPLPEESRYAG